MLFGCTPMKNSTGWLQADASVSFQCSPVTLRLCVLLSGWSRQILSAWLANAPSPVELLQTAGKPDDGYRRKTVLTGFSEAKTVPRDLTMLKQRSVAVVGARKGTEPGRAIARSLAVGLVARGCTLVSGLAVGIDAEAHRCTSTAPGGKTVADLSSPLDEASAQILDAIAAKPRQFD
jgi:hypothetical protein